jgi:hypothetical protein
MHFDVNVKFDMLILWLLVIMLVRGNLHYTALTFINRSRAFVNVGMACLGSLVVRTCSIPSVPYQFLSRIRPIVENLKRQEHGFVEEQLAYPWNLLSVPSLP